MVEAGTVSVATAGKLMTTNYDSNSGRNWLMTLQIRNNACCTWIEVSDVYNLASVLSSFFKQKMRGAEGQKADIIIYFFWFSFLIYVFGWARCGRRYPISWFRSLGKLQESLFLEGTWLYIRRELIILFIWCIEYRSQTTCSEYNKEGQNEKWLQYLGISISINFYGSGPVRGWLVGGWESSLQLLLGSYSSIGLN